MLQFAQNVCGDLEQALTREWLETNGLGGFASSTIIGLNTRRYHGLLFAATKPPTGRKLLLSKLEETLIVDGQRFDVSTNRYPGAIHPEGHRLQTEFRLDPHPVFAYSASGIEIEKNVLMIQGRNTVYVDYRMAPSSWPVHLEIRPLLAFRDYHALTHENPDFDPSFDSQPGIIRIRPYPDLPSLFLGHNNAQIKPSGFWYRDFEYSAERERGLDFREDLFNPFVMTFDLSVTPEAVLIASVDPMDVTIPSNLLREEVARRAKSKPLSVRSTLENAADKFIVARNDKKTVIAGYHWFTDWSRDTMISLSGLTLAGRKLEIAKSILEAFALYADKGMLPNRFPDAGEEPEYNTVDGTLWFFEAIQQYLEHTGDHDFVGEKLYPVLVDIIDWHVKGTRYGIRVDSDGLLESGAEGVQLTWMDAKVGDWVVTPRRGKPVEIQALWYNALRIMEELAGRFGDDAKPYADRAEQAKRTFDSLFWNPDAGCLYDVIDGDSRDSSIRPNQVLAISLTNSILSSDKAQSILRVVERDLLTARGLRTLAQSDPNYRGRYEGDPMNRDSAYHQGTVWPWLIGPFFRAWRREFGDTEETRKKIASWLGSFSPHLSDAGLGQVSEIFDGDPPHRPNGCIAQAWSIAEILRLLEHPK